MEENSGAVAGEIHFSHNEMKNASARKASAKQKGGDFKLTPVMTWQSADTFTDTVSVYNKFKSPSISHLRY